MVGDLDSVAATLEGEALDDLNTVDLAMQIDDEALVVIGPAIAGVVGSKADTARMTIQLKSGACHVAARFVVRKQHVGAFGVQYHAVMGKRGIDDIAALWIDANIKYIGYHGDKITCGTRLCRLGWHCICHSVLCLRCCGNR